MAEDTNDRHDGVQIKVWVPEGFYDMLKSLAVRHRTSVAAEARRLMVAGVEPSEAVDALAEGLVELDRFIRLHLEPLTFVAAMDSAKVAAYERQRIAAQRQLHLASHPRPDGKDDSEHQANFIDRQMAERATKRIKRVLREIESPALDREEEEGEEDDHADEE